MEGNKLRQERLRWAGGYLGVDLGLATYILLALRGFLGNDNTYCMIAAEVALGLLAFMGVGSLMLAARTPSRVGTGPPGIGFRRGLLLEPETTELIGWDEIADIEDHCGPGGTRFILTKKDGLRRTFEVDPFLQTELVDLASGWMEGGGPGAGSGPGEPPTMVDQARALAGAWIARVPALAGDGDPGATSRLPAPAPEAPSVEPRPVGPLAPSAAPPAIRWLRSNARRVLLAWFLAFFVATEMLAYITGYYFPNANPACYILGLLAWTALLAIVLKMAPANPVGLSEAGIHVRTNKGLVPHEEFVPWDEVAKVRPEGALDLVIIERSGRTVEVTNAGRAVHSDINSALEARYYRLSGKASRVNPADNRMGGLGNRPRALLHVRIGASLAIVIISSVQILGWPPTRLSIDNVTILLWAALAVAGFVALRKSLGDWNAVPTSVALTPVGVYIRYKGPLPPGTTDFAAWADIASLDPPARWDPEADTARAVVLVKKSGASYFLGPLDPAIVSELKSRAASILK